MFDVMFVTLSLVYQTLMNIEIIYLFLYTSTIKFAITSYAWVLEIIRYLKYNKKII